MQNERVINQCSVVLTRNCNLRCGFCFAKGAGYCESEHIEFEKLKKIVDFCVELQVNYIFFTGGEPLLYPFLSDILVYTKEQKHQIKTAVASNGILLANHQFCKKLVDSGLDYVDISMKGKDPEEWLSSTRYDGYAKQQKAIKNLSSLRIDFTCSMVITMANVFSIYDSVAFAIENGAKQFSFTFVIDNNNEISDREKYLEKNNPFELIEAFISQMDRLNALTNEWWIEYSFPLCVYTEKQLTLLEDRLATPCQVHKGNAITLDTQLNLLPCDMYFHEKIGKFGVDFNNASEFFELRNNNPYKKSLDDINRLPSNKCHECDYLDKCFGGCPVLWKNYSFDLLQSEKMKRNSTI